MLPSVAAHAVVVLISLFLSLAVPAIRGPLRRDCVTLVTLFKKILYTGDTESLDVCG